MMNRESGAQAASVAMTSPPNQLELLRFSPQWPGLVAGKLAHICERLAKAGCELKSSRDVRPRTATTPIWPALPMDVRPPPVLQPLG
jgi:hypothetical protein